MVVVLVGSWSSESRLTVIVLTRSNRYQLQSCFNIRRNTSCCVYSVAGSNVLKRGAARLRYAALAVLQLFCWRSDYLARLAAGCHDLNQSRASAFYSNPSVFQFCNYFESYWSALIRDESRSEVVRVSLPPPEPNNSLALTNEDLGLCFQRGFLGQSWWLAVMLRVIRNSGSRK